MSVEMQTKPAPSAPSPVPAGMGAGELPIEYGETNRAAILALVFGGLSLLGMMFPPLLFLAIIGMMFAGLAYWQLGKEGDEASGHWAANGAMGLCLSVLVVGGGWNFYDYATEVPEGAQRVGFFDLQPSEDHPELPIPPEALALNGKRVFIKGYVFPDGQTDGIKRFILVPDQGTCCFGGDPKPTDMILVQLRDPHRTHYSWNMRKLAGTLTVAANPKSIIKGKRGIHYMLDADYVQ